MGLVGGFLARHEADMLRLAGSVEGVPRLMGRWGATGIVREYIEGRSLARTDVPNEEFFPNLERMLRAFHA